jgi:hypothetical protein
MGSDLCPDSVKQAAQQPAAQRSASGSGSSLSRIFTRSTSAPAAPAAPACRTQYKICGDVLAVAKRCRETFGCRAFSYDGRCGYLKSSDGPRRSRTGWCACARAAVMSTVSSAACCVLRRLPVLGRQR